MNELHHFISELILNMDETGIEVDKFTDHLVIIFIDEIVPAIEVNAKMEHMTFCTSITASGIILKHMLILKELTQPELP